MQGKIRRIDREAQLKTLLAKMDAIDRKSKTDEGAMDTSDALPGKRTRATVGDLHPAFVAEEGVAMEHTQRQAPDFKSRRNATHASAVEGVGAANPASKAEKCNRASGQEFPEGGGKVHERLARPRPRKRCAPPEAIVDTHWAIAKRT